MKTKNLLKEAIIWAIIIIPFVYYAVVYSKLPAQVPIHFDLHGTPDNYASKSAYWWIIASTTLGMYLLLLIIPLIDPKHRLQQMGNKYYTIKLLLVTLMSLLSVFSIYMAQNPSANKSFILMLVFGLFFIVLGNYMPSFKPNYFIGIRTPWTLESEDIWRRTHRFGGWLWLATGLLIIIFTLLKTSPVVSFVLAITAALVPVIYSFVLYLKHKDQSAN